ncbi:MAG TPA: DMT family transporter [Desulfotignum sp.]|jgi:drug/metabolite transporter (DMT)-like permease|nr:DMT family transporter [Desulfotignum sp.]
MKSGTVKSDLVLLLAASIWGLAFVAQRIGMDHVGPFTFNGLRFVLGGLSLLPFVWLSRKKTYAGSDGDLIKSGMVSGVVLFAGISFQQVGIVYTTAGKAGFITGLYVVMVPIIGLFLRHTRTGAGTWAGAGLASIGMYLLSVTRDMDVNSGDMLVFFSAICFACHLIVIERFCTRFSTAALSLVQCTVCAVLSLGVAAVFETFVLADILKITIPLIYGGVFSVGVAYSLQIYGQKNSPASHAAIILCLESVVAAIGGWIILNEILSGRAIFGCVLMLAGMLVSQLYAIKKHASV